MWLLPEGDKVAAEAQFGYSVNGFGIGDLVERMNGFSDAEVAALVAEYREAYSIAAAHDRPGSLAGGSKDRAGPDRIS